MILGLFYYTLNGLALSGTPHLMANTYICIRQSVLPHFSISLHYMYTWWDTNPVQSTTNNSISSPPFIMSLGSGKKLEHPQEPRMDTVRTPKTPHHTVTWAQDRSGDHGARRQECYLLCHFVKVLCFAFFPVVKSRHLCTVRLLISSVSRPYTDVGIFSLSLLGKY